MIGLNENEASFDFFAGAGGASAGIEQGLKRSIDIAINHDLVAIKMHKTNHRKTKHFCENVWEVDPVKACAGRPVGMAWFSPDCKHFSIARGGTPVDKNIRGLAWVVLKWCAQVPVRVFMLENVVEFRGWGPLIEYRPGKFKPDPKMKGTIYDAFISILTTGLNKNHFVWDEIRECLGDDFPHYDKLEKGLGYKVEARVLSACDYGAPTTRKRLYMVARKDDEPIVWPRPSHGPSSACKQPYKTTADIIDWSVPTKSIFGRKKPLAENTLKRIAKGIKKFVIDNPDPFIVRIGQTGFGKDNLSYSLNDPLTTITSKNEHLLITPVITRHFGNSIGHGVDSPLGTVTANGGGKSQLVEASLVARQNSETTGSEVNAPYSAVKSIDHDALVTSHVIKFRGSNSGHKTDEPLHTISAGGTHLGEVRAFLIKYYSSNVGHSLNEPLQTITAKERFGLVTIHGQEYEIVDIRLRMLQPHELFKAQGFPDDYIFDRTYDGKKLSKADQVAKCGNAVCPPVAKALVEANFGVVPQKLEKAA